ncbi:MAG: DUF4339 domain-containing protein [Acidobacteria bacterium]|nr:DUF4339 domain-containing protein [Acidobacteriota bacterium]MCW5949872.1 DUF4339 domain-containing protein [Pyrinomonadaceae bacterium]
MADIFIQKLEGQGPFSDEQIVERIRAGTLAPQDLISRHGTVEWKPIYALVDLPEETIAEYEAAAEREFRLLSRYLAEIEGAQQRWSQDEHNSGLKRDFEQKLQVFQKQIYEFREQFPDAEGGRMMLSLLYVKYSLLKGGQSSYFRRAANRSETIVGGLVTGLIANHQENKHMTEALAFAESAVQIHDNAIARMMKANVLIELKRTNEAIADLDQIIANFADEEDVYFEARKMRDELMMPSAKSGMCFIATAAYGSPLMPEVVLLKRYRDEILLLTRAGSVFVRVYYLLSPPFASLISKVEMLRIITRTFVLSPILRFVESRMQILPQAKPKYQTKTQEEK